MKRGRKLLKELAEIYSGISFRSELASDKDGDAYLVQMKNLNENENLNLSDSLETFSRIKKDTMKQSYALKQGDILFRSRGASFSSVIVGQSFANVFPVSPLYLIRVRSEKLLPGYLLWFINSSNTQKYLQQMSEGTQIKMLSKKKLDDLEIRIPSLEKQQRIIEIKELFRKEKMLSENLMQKKKDYLEAVLRREIL